MRQHHTSGRRDAPPTTFVSKTPVRADLAAVAPMYYPIVEHGRFGSVKALCKRHGLPVELVQEHQQHAACNCSEQVVLGNVFLRDPSSEMVAVLIFQPGGAVVLCAGLFAEASENAEDAHAILMEFAALPEFEGKLLAVGEFRPNPRGALLS